MSEGNVALIRQAAHLLLDAAGELEAQDAPAYTEALARLLDIGAVRVDETGDVYADPLMHAATFLIDQAVAWAAGRTGDAPEVVRFMLRTTIDENIVPPGDG